MNDGTQSYLVIMTTVNVLIQVIALWQRSYTAGEARRKRLKRNGVKVD